MSQENTTDTYLDRVIHTCLNFWATHMYSIIAFIIITCAVLLFLIFRPRPGNYYDYCVVCPALGEFTAETCENWFETYRNTLLNMKEPTVLFDAIGRDTPQMTADYPEILAQCLRVPNVQRCFIIKVARRTEQKECRYSAAWANTTLRCVIPIYVPQGNQTAVVVDQEIKFIKVDKPIVFDASHPNRLFNKQKRRDAILLILDIQRPTNIPLGVSNVADGPYITEFTTIE